jgi:hypothetical protein
MNTRALLLALPLVVLGSCRDNRVSVDIQQICYPTDNCTFAATCDKQLIGAPRIDTSATNASVKIPLQVANHMPDNTDVPSGRLNSNDAHFDQVAIEYEGAALSRDVFDLSNQRVPAGGTAVVMFDVVRSWNWGALQDAYNGGARSVIAKIRLRGYTDDGARFETGEFPTAFKLCSGCVLGCPADKPFACPSYAMDPQTCYSTAG